MWQYNYYNPQTELYHYGVLGMKWGHRKARSYEKKSKNLKGSAKEWDEMSSYQSSKGNNKKASKYKNFAKEDRRKARDYSNRSKQIKAEINIKKDHAEASKNRRQLSDSDLDKRINRLQKEQKLKGLTEAELHPGRTAAKNFIKSTGGKVATSAAAGAIAYLGYSYMEAQGWNRAASYMFPNPNKKK